MCAEAEKARAAGGYGCRRTTVYRRTGAERNLTEYYGMKRRFFAPRHAYTQVNSRFYALSSIARQSEGGSVSSVIFRFHPFSLPVFLAAARVRDLVTAACHAIALLARRRKPAGRRRKRISSLIIYSSITQRKPMSSPRSLQRRNCSALTAALRGARRCEPPSTSTRSSNSSVEGSANSRTLPAMLRTP